MYSHGPNDAHSKEGTGRVALFKATGLKNCVTVEAAYYMRKPVHHLGPLVNLKVNKRFKECPLELDLPEVYNRSYFDDLGSALLYSILDMHAEFCISRLPLTQFRNVHNLRDFLRIVALRPAKDTLIGRSSKNPRPVKVRKRSVR